jgi:hypothetical protein
MLRRTCPTHEGAVELLLKRALQRALAGSLVAGAGLGAGCSIKVVHDSDDQPGSTEGTESDGSLSDHDGGGAGPSGPHNEGGAGQDAGPQQPLGAPIDCPENAWFPVQASGLRPRHDYDYVAIRRRVGTEGGEETDAGDDDSWVLPLKDVQVLSETGSPCATASDERCEAKIEHHQAPFKATKCEQLCSEFAVVTTRADEVARFVTPDELRALLGTIDSFDDALMLVNAARYDVTCNDAARTSVAEVDDGYIVYATRVTADCAPVVTTRYKLHVSRDGQISVLHSEELTRVEELCIGRKPEGLRSANVRRGRSKLGDYLARCAHLEAASVFSFTRLIRELEAHGAPAALIARAKQARADEVRHAQTVGGLARIHGGELVPVDVESLCVRALEAIALENAIEGCVRETYGALVGAHQARCAEDFALRRALSDIAEDEARHASLAHAVHAWIMPKLDVKARRRVRMAQALAVAELARDVALPKDAELTQMAGLPSPEVARRLVQELTESLWAPMLRAA